MNAYVDNMSVRGGKICHLHGCYVQTLPLINAVKRKIQTNGENAELQPKNRHWVRPNPCR